jgi:hypothetical protein
MPGAERLISLSYSTLGNLQQRGGVAAMPFQTGFNHVVADVAAGRFPAGIAPSDLQAPH